MTENRRRYLAGISNEDRYIRQEIAQLETEIMLFKGYSKGIRKEVYRASCMYEAFKADKNIIKALKKHLPQLMYFDNEENHFGWNCPTCHCRIVNLGGRLDAIRRFCPACGQKLLDKNSAY